MDCTKLVAIDLDLAQEGYLTGPTGHTRFIHGLDALARDAAAAGCTIYWSDAPAFRGREVAGLCYVWSGRILLASWLFTAAPWRVRRVFSHEVLHHSIGTTSEPKVQEWQSVFYGEAVEPVAWMRVGVSGERANEWV